MLRSVCLVRALASFAQATILLLVISDFHNTSGVLYFHRMQLSSAEREKNVTLVHSGNGAEAFSYIQVVSE